MTISSFAIRNVVAAYQRQLRGHTPRGDPGETEDAAETDGTEEGPPGSRVRERFGDEAIREFRNASLDAYRTVQDL
jgi:hypothetical protein